MFLLAECVQYFHKMKDLVIYEESLWEITHAFTLLIYLCFYAVFKLRNRLIYCCKPYVCTYVGTVFILVRSKTNCTSGTTILQNYKLQAGYLKIHIHIYKNISVRRYFMLFICTYVSFFRKY